MTVEPVERDHPPGEEYVGETVRIGSVTATNEFVFRRTLDLPSLSGCAVGTDAPDDRFAHVSYEAPSYRQPEAIAGGQSLAFGGTADVPVSVNATEPVDFAVEYRESCLDGADRPTVVVTTGRSPE